MKYDDYREVVNDDETYRTIADHINKGQNVVIGWTDGNETHYDILFAFCAVRYGTLQGGVSGGDLFVAIMRGGAFGFDIVEKDTHPEYYAEKLGITGQETKGKLAELINGVKQYI